MKTVEDLKKRFLENFPDMNECVAHAVSILVLSREELLKENELKNFPKEHSNKFAKDLADSDIKEAVRLLIEAKPTEEREKELIGYNIRKETSLLMLKHTSPIPELLPVIYNYIVTGDGKELTEFSQKHQPNEPRESE